MEEKRGEAGLGGLVTGESSQYDVLFVTRPVYTMLGNKIPSTYSRTTAKNLIEGSELISNNTYLAVITDDSAIARRASQKRIPFCSIVGRISVNRVSWSANWVARFVPVVA